MVTTSHTGARPLFGLWTTLLIAALLVVPFAFHYLLKTEPYPAIIFPSGHQIETRILGDRATFTDMNLVGFDQSGQAVRLDITDLLYPIPWSHANGLVGTRFGQDTSSTKVVRSGRLGLEIEVPRHVPSQQDREAARAWIAEKLERAGLQPDQLVVRYDRVEVDRETGELISRETTREVIILGD